MQKIYIAGKITGEENYRQKFKAAQDELLELDERLILQGGRRVDG